MNRGWKILSLVVALLLLPVAAYAVGAITAPADEPVPRGDITITDTPTPSPSPAARPGSAGSDVPGAPSSRRGDRDDDDRVRVVTPRPAPVDKVGGADRNDDDGDDDDHGDDDDGDDDDGADDD